LLYNRIEYLKKSVILQDKIVEEQKMSVFLQMGIGLGAVCVVMWLILILRKKKKVKGVVYATFMTLACIALVICDFAGVWGKGTEQESDMPGAEMMTFANALASYGSYDEAREMLTVYSAKYGYDEECSLLNARIYALQENYTQAAGVYKRLMQNEAYAEAVEEECKDILAKNSVNMGQLGMVNYLTSQGSDLSAYGYTKEQADEMKATLQITAESISDKIRDAMEETYEIDKYEEVAESISEAERVYVSYGAERYDNLTEESQKEIKSVKSDLEDAIEEYAGVENLAFVRDALLKVRLMLSEYDEIAEHINGKATYTELIVASRLYQKKAVKDKDFAEQFVAEYENNSKQIYKKLKAIYREVKSDLSTIEKQELESLIETWNIGADYPAMMFLKNELESRLATGEVGRESSKVHLELAQMEHFLRNSDGRENSISDALASGYESEDVAYREAMSKINGVIENTDDIAAILNVGSYVRDALENSVPIETYDLIPKEILEDEEVSRNGSGELELVSEEGGEDELQDFESAFTDDVSKLMNSMSISSVDASRFETVEAYISLSSDFATTSEELKEILSLYDCGFEITDFAIEKVEYSGFRTYLLCDVSGSMDSSMPDLRNAVTAYINARGTDEELAISTFSSSITATMDFGASSEELLEFASGMRDGGGTAIVSSAIQVLKNFSASRDAKQVLIVMTDGQDGGSYSKSDIIEQIGSLAEQKNVTVHTIGLGSVDANYLNTIAASGNGMFVYVSDSGSLGGFYELLHGQVDNQYKITFQAEDTMTLMNRTLEMKVKGSTVQDSITYSIGDEEAAGEGTALDATTLSVSGLRTRYVYKSKEDVENALLGTGFDPESHATLTLVGENEYSIPLEYESENRYNLVIPAKVDAGMYDLLVSIGGKKALIKNGLIIENQGEQKVTAFGPYSFTSIRKEVDGDTYLLSGNVVMNGWLRFKGDVKITGDLSAGLSITVEDYSGSYVMFDDATATGLGAYYASKDMFVDVPVLGKFELIYDDHNLYDYEEYKVEDIYTASMRLLQIATYDSLVWNLYPDRLELKYSEFHIEFPTLEDIFDTGDGDIFEFEAEGKGILNSQNIGIEFEGSAGFDAEQFCKVNMMNSPVLLNKAGVEAKINTWSEEYEFAAEVDLAIVDFGVGASVGFKNTKNEETQEEKLRIDKFSVTLDFPVTVTMGGVPVTFSDFMLGAEDIAEAVEKKRFSAVTLKGGLSISAYDISAICPPLEEFVGDVSLLSLDETEFALKFKPMMFKASTEMKFLEQITLAKSELEVGTFEYSNGMLGLAPTDVSGMRAALTQGFMWELDNLEFNISATGEIDALSRFFGVQMNGTAYIEASWWWFNVSLDESGDILLGMYITDSGAKQFTIIVDYEYDPWLGDPYTKRDMFYLDENGNFQHDDEKVTL